MKRRIEQDRLQRAKDIAHAVRTGQYIQAPIDAQASFFPPRPTIKKDKREMARVYGEGEAD